MKTFLPLSSSDDEDKDDERTDSIDPEEMFQNIQYQKEIIANIRTRPWPMRRKLKVLKSVFFRFTNVSYFIWHFFVETCLTVNYLFDVYFCRTSQIISPCLIWEARCWWRRRPRTCVTSSWWEELRCAELVPQITAFIWAVCYPADFITPIREGFILHLL